MNKKIYIVVILIIMMTILTGCENVTQKKSKTIEENKVENVQNNNIPNNEVEEEEKATLKNGKYKMVVQNQNEEIPEEVIYVDIYNGELKLIDVYARITQAGNYEIVGNKLIGQYNEITYFDQNTDNMTSKEINDKIEFEIINEETIKDNKGFGKMFNNILYQGETYKLFIQ